MGCRMEIQLLGNAVPPSHMLNSVQTALTWCGKGRERIANGNKISEKNFKKN